MAVNPINDHFYEDAQKYPLKLMEPYFQINLYGGFQSHGGTPIWMVYFMENAMDIFGGPLFSDKPN